MSSLPTVPTSVGGDVDLMIGIKYLRYHPEQIFKLPSGLTIYKSIFKNIDGSRGVIGGPHKIFSAIESHGICKNAFLINQLNSFESGFQVNPDIKFLQYHSDDTDNKSYLKRQKLFEMAEDAGSDISYRCIKCRSCTDCKNHDVAISSSIREEVEQQLINESVTVDTKNNITSASLPFIQDPKLRLQPNRHKALKVYQQQTRRLGAYPKDRQDVINSEQKLQDLGHVDFVRNLSAESQYRLQINDVQNFIPWRAVWKTSSLTTPCRIVFDASQPTGSGYSLNSILAKGTNGMNKLAEIFIRWFTHKVALHTDVCKMYNSIKLKEEDWCYQRYLWNDSLAIGSQPEEKVIKTLIYGVRSSGNQAERGLRQTAQLSKEEFPEVYSTIVNDTYVDDCITGHNSKENVNKLADEMEIVCSKGGFGLKGFTFTGKDPPDKLSKDGKSISTGGMLWYSNDDDIAIDFTELNFAKKVRGKKPASNTSIPTNITRRQCVSKVSEVFDITGKLTPITASFKIDLHNLIERNIGWDDAIPDSLRPIWVSHFEMMEEIKNIRFSRCVIPVDAYNTEISTLDFGDASKSIAAVAIYARVRRKNGQYSSQLIFARSKIIPKSTSQPRAELMAAVLNSHTGEVVRRALKDKHSGWTKLTDSQIVLHWLSNDDINLKQFARNRVIEIKRFTKSEDWYYINTQHMLADIATRRGSTLKDVDRNSKWINGEDWMKKSKADLPIKTVSDIILNVTELHEIQNEATSTKLASKDVFNCDSRRISLLPKEVKERYLFSSYLIDPNKFSFKKVVRILAIVIRYVKLLKSLVIKQSSSINQIKTRSSTKLLQKPGIVLSNEEINAAEEYFWRKGSAEVRFFVKQDRYKRFSQDINGILMYNGRLLPTDEIQIITPLTSVMKDLQSTTFCVPVLDKHSPISYAIINDVHWNDPVVKHSGIESTWRYVLKKAFIIEGRELVKRIRRSCTRCRYIEKQKIQVEMGKVSLSSITIAPAFFNTQVDLAGPFVSFSNVYKRKSIKIWLTVFICTTTSTTAIKVMDDYSSPAFIQAFTRFACDSGYPNTLYVDRGSQLLKSCKEIQLNFQDLRFKLHHDVHVNFELCPVGGHNYHGKVERKIREIKSSLEKSYNGQRLSLLQWETVSAEIVNTINDLPLSLGNCVSDFKTMDLITPNRLKLGRNNARSPIGPYEVTSNPSRIAKSN